MQEYESCRLVKAIATRISDEWHGKTEFPEDTKF